MFVQEVCIVETSLGHAEVTRIGEIEEVGANLQPLSLAQTRILQNAEVDAVNSICTQNVAPSFTGILVSIETAEKIGAVASRR